MQTYPSKQDFLDIKEAYRHGSTIKGTLEEEFQNGNGYEVTLYNGVMARIFSRHLPNFRVHTGDELSFKVTGFKETNNEFNCTVRYVITVSYFQWRAEGLTEGSIISSIVTRITTGYIVLNFQGINLYLSKEELGEHTVIQDGDLSSLVGHIMTVMVTSIDNTQANIQVSEKSYIKEAGTLIKGQRYEAIVTGIDKDFVNIEVDGRFPAFISKKDLQWGHADIGYETFIGERRDVKFLGINEGMLFFSSKPKKVSDYKESLYKADAAALLSDLGFKHNSFTGRISSDRKNDFQILENIIADNIEDKGALLADPFTAEPIKVIVPKEYHSMFENGRYYHFSLVEAPPYIRKRENCPYRFTLDDSSFIPNGIVPVDDPYKRLVEVQATKFSEPGPNRALASTLEEVGEGLYDSKDRMFFELLQNADDASADSGVKVFLEAVDGHLLLSHNGRAFNRKDFSSITSSGSSNKGSDKKKTGYKGIGFKSVFTNSSTVRIMSGGFNFLFDKTRPIYQTFEDYYFPLKNLTTPEDQERFIDDNRDDYEVFKGVDSIPWQLIPIWSKELPTSLKRSIFSSRSNVSIALGMDDASKKEYLDAIVDVLNDPKFMLFLRNTTRIRLKDGKNEFNLAKKTDDSGIVTIQSTQAGNEILQRFFVEDGTHIALSDQAFSDTGVDIIIREKTGMSQAKTEHVFEDSNGKKIPQIPPRISESNFTEISFAVWLEDDGKTFKAQTGSNSFYAYLPMVEKRFPFPIYINADFVLKSNRQGIKSDNPWNHFLMYHIGLSYPKWVGSIADKEQPQYLNLLPRHLFSEDDKDQAVLAKMFNTGYMSSLGTEKFILNDEGELVGQSDIIVDHTGLSEITGGDDFCFLLDVKDRRLPYASMDNTILDERIFTDVKRIDSVKEVLMDPKNLKYIRHWFSHAPKEKKVAALAWVRKQNDIQLGAYLPLLSFSGKCRSINEASGRQYLYITADLLPAYHILNKLGFSCLNYRIETHPLYEALLKDLLKESIASQVATIMSWAETKVAALGPTDKVTLYNVVTGLCTRKDQKEALSGWKLFTNTENSPMPLSMLMAMPQDESESLLLSNHIVSEKELSVMDNGIKGKMMPISKVYRTVFLEGWDTIAKRWLDKAKKRNNLTSGLIDIYKATSKYFKASEEFIKEPETAPTLSGKDFVLVEKGCQDSSQEKIVAFYNPVLEDKKVYEVLCKACSDTFPIYDSLKYLKEKPFVKKQNEMSTLHFKEGIHLCASEIITIIDAFSSNKESFFKEYRIVSNESGFDIVKRKPEEWLFFTDSLALRAFISTSCIDAFSVPTSFRKYADGEYVLKNIEIFTKLFDILSVQDNYKTLIPIVTDESAEVKKLFLSNLSAITLTKESLAPESDEFKLLRLGCSLFKPEEKTQKIYPSSSVISIAYSIEDGSIEAKALDDIPMQGKVCIGNHTFSLDDLRPGDLKSFQQEAKGVLEKLVALGIGESYLNSLFSIDATNNPDEVFSTLNGTTLQNGKQLAFMLRYKEEADKAKHQCTLSVCLSDETDKNAYYAHIWFICAHSFIRSDLKLNKKYWDVLDCLESTEYRDDTSPIWFATSPLTYEHIKTVLSENEGKDLLNYMFDEWRAKRTVWDKDTRSTIASRLSLDTNSVIGSDSYALPEERLSGTVLNWKPIFEGKNQFLEEVFCIKGDNSDIVKARKYMSGGGDKPTVTLNQADQLKLCCWISAKSLTLDEKSFDFFKEAVAQKLYSDQVDYASLKKLTTVAQKTVRSFSIYKHNGAMPHKVSFLSTQNPLCFYNYSEGDWFVNGTSIYVNAKEWNNLGTVLVAVLADSGNTFGKDDLLTFYQSENTGFLERNREMDDELENLRSQLNAYKLYFEEQNLDMTAIDRKMSGLSKDQMWEALKEARRLVRIHLRNQGYSVPIEDERREDWTIIKNVYDNDGNSVTIIVRSFIDNTSRHFVLDADEWIHLTKDEKAELWVRTGQGKIRCYDFKSLVRDKHKLAFEFSTVNIDFKGKMDALAQILRWFNGLNFDFGSVLPEGSSTAELFLKKDVKLEEVLTADNESFFPGKN